MIDASLIKVEFDDNGLSPYEISVKYKISIERVYEILESDDKGKSK